MKRTRRAVAHGFRRRARQHRRRIIEPRRKAFLELLRRQKFRVENFGLGLIFDARLREIVAERARVR